MDSPGTISHQSADTSEESSSLEPEIESTETDFEDGEGDTLPSLPLHFGSAELDCDRYEEGLGIEYYLSKGRAMEAFLVLLRRTGRDPSLPLTLHMAGSTNEEAGETTQHCEMKIMTDGDYSAESLLTTAHSVALRNFLQRDVVSACIAFVLQCRWVGMVK